MKKILITGGSGFIGTNLVNYLNKGNYKIYNIDKISYASTPEKFKILKNKKNYFFFKVNLSDTKKFKKILTNINPDFIIHMAAESHVDRSIDDPFNFIKENINSTIALYDSVLKLAKNGKIDLPKIIQISTDEVYGDVTTGTSSENSLYKPSSPYSSSKASSDLIAKSFMYTYRFKLSILKICNNFGPYQFTEKFIPTILNRIDKHKKIPIYGNGKHIREWIYVEDTCEAIETVLQNFKNGIDYNVGSKIRLSNIKLVKKIISIKKLKKPNLLIDHVLDRPGHDTRYAINSNKIKQILKWSPRHDLKNSLKKTIKWYSENHKWKIYVNKNYKERRLGKV